MGVKIEIREKYRCSECGRSEEFIINTKGLTTFGRCVITKNCSGSLFRERGLDSKIKPMGIEGGEIEDWTQTPILYVHEQDTPSRRWEIMHRMKSIPFINVYDKNGIEITDFIILEQSSDNAIIELPEPIEGLVHCIRREVGGGRDSGGVGISEFLGGGDNIFDYNTRLPIAI